MLYLAVVGRAAAREYVALDGRVSGSTSALSIMLMLKTKLRIIDNSSTWAFVTKFGSRAPPSCKITVLVRLWDRADMGRCIPHMLQRRL
jgi:hypothetical protein